MRPPRHQQWGQVESMSKVTGDSGVDDDDAHVDLVHPPAPRT